MGKKKWDKLPCVEKISITPGSTIRVGTAKGHPCFHDGTGLLPEGVAVEIKDEHDQRIMVQNMIRCPKCHAIYLSYKLYVKCWPKLKAFNCLDKDTGKPTRESLLFQRDKYDPASVEANGYTTVQAYETPVHIVNAIKRPYQGGSCSGK